MPLEIAIFLAFAIPFIAALFFLFEACRTLFEEVRKLRHRIDELERLTDIHYQ